MDFKQKSTRKDKVAFPIVIKGPDYQDIITAISTGALNIGAAKFTKQALPYVKGQMVQ